jgi:hypothetical protein
MCIEIDIVLESEYVCLRCTGPCSLAEVKKICSQAVDVVLEHEMPKVLVDANGVTGNLSTMDRFKSAEYLADDIIQRALGKLTKIAFVAKVPPLDPERFGETVARNRGVNAKATTDIDEAIMWLGQ